MPEAEEAEDPIDVHHNPLSVVNADLVTVQEQFKVNVSRKVKEVRSGKGQLFIPKSAKAQNGLFQY